MSPMTAAGAAGNSINMLEQMTDIVANNLSNVNTPGFQSMIMTVMGGQPTEMLRSSDDGVTSVGTVEGMPQGLVVSVNQQAGTMQPTGNPLDLALSGPGYFVVATGPSGVALTRSGSFRVDTTGQIVTGNGDPVMGANGPILIPQNTQKITVASDGTVSADNVAVGQFQFAAPPAPLSIVPLGGALYQSTAPIVPPTTPPSVIQGSLEMSNVSSVDQMVRLITVLRVYQELTQGLQMDNETKNLATQNVGLVS